MENQFRLSLLERRAMKKMLANFCGQSFLFGSRTDLTKRGGDIDVLLIPDLPENPLLLKARLKSVFQQELEQSIDLVIYDNKKVFANEILKYAKPFTPSIL